MEIYISYFAALLIGISLGMIGGGGSILTVPVLVYLLGLNPVISTAYSLFIVGSSASIGAINSFRKGLICTRTALFFAIPSFISVYLTRRYLIPNLPETLFTVAGFNVTKSFGIMLFFALIMLLAAISMLRSPIKEANIETTEKNKLNIPLIVIDGLVVGTLTGIVGAGGGFLIIPALVLLAKLPMKIAVGTSLLIIAAKSLIGFIGDVQSGQQIDWYFLLTFTSFAILGILVGGYFSNFISNKKLKKAFGWLVLIMAFYIIFKETYI